MAITDNGWAIFHPPVIILTAPALVLVWLSVRMGGGGGRGEWRWERGKKLMEIGKGEYEKTEIIMIMPHQEGKEIG